MRGALLLLVWLTAGCNDLALGDNPARAPEHARHHMREHVSDLRTIEQMLLAGELENAKTLAFMLTRAGHAFGAPDEARDTVLAAGTLQQAQTLEEALRAEARVAAACASCHERAQKLPVFELPSKAPPDRPTTAAQMARHRWAVDRAWEGLIGASEAHWQAGMFALSRTNLPWARGVDQPDRALQLRRSARRIHDRELTTTEARAEAYGELLVMCAGCHTTFATSRARKAGDTAAR